VYGATALLAPVIWIFNAWIFADHIERFEKCISLSDIMEKLYGKLARKITVFLSVFDCIGAVAMQVSALSFLSSYLFGVHHLIGVFISSAVIMVYLIVGGAKSIVVNDIFQFCIFYVAIPLLCAISLHEAGGLQEMVAKVPAELKEINFNGVEKWVFISLVLYALLPETSAPLVQRFLMARNSTHLKKSLFYVAFLNVSFAITMLVIGFTSVVLAPDIEPSKALYHMIATYLPVGMVGLLISGLLAIIMSTAHSWLNTAAVVISDDIAPYFIKDLDPQKKLFIARIAVVFVMIGAIIMTVACKGIIAILWLSENIWLPVMLVPIILGFKGFNAKPITFYVSMIAGLSATFTGAFIRQDFDTFTLFLGIFASLIAFLTTHQLQNSSLNKICSIRSYLKQYLNFSHQSDNLKHVLYDETFFNTSKSVVFWGFIFFQYIPSMLEASLSGVITDPIQMSLRSLPVLLVVIFMTHEYWNHELKAKCMMPLWNFILFYTLSFNAILMLMLNQNKIIWATNLMISSILLAMLLNTRRAFIMLLLGLIFSFTIKTLYTFSEATIHLSQFDSSILALSYAAISIGLSIGLILSLNTVFSHDIIAKDEEIRCIAHEAKAPFATCYTNISSIEEMISSLTFNASSHANLSKDDVDHISYALGKLKSICTEGIQSISSILHTNTAIIEPINLKELIDYIKRKIGESRINNDIKDDIFFNGYKISIQVALENILKNASVHSKASEIKVYTSNDLIIIEDNGIGIENRNLKSIFTDGNTTSESGTGYGLGIAKRLIEQHGGAVYIDSEPKAYTRFTINLNRLYSLSENTGESG
ncbi:MAG: sodium:solute symporter family transporter, partial [Alphaproteobacteria bacterium]